MIKRLRAFFRAWFKNGDFNLRQATGLFNIWIAISSAIFCTITLSVGCGTASNSSSGTEDTSASGAAAGAVGGALSGSNSTGTQAFFMPLFNPPQQVTLLSSIYHALNFISPAYAATACPTFKTIGTGCTTTSSNMWLTLSTCSWGTSSAAWTGIQGLFASTGTVNCGTLPSPMNGSLTRQFVAAALGTTPATGTVVSSFGTTAVIDHSTTNLGNFNSDTIATLLNGGYGEQVTFASGKRTSVNLQQRIYATGSFDHSMTGALTISETAGSSTRTISGTMTVYHNLAKVIGTAVFSNVTHSDGCCYPTGGSITTTFAAGTPTPTSTGSAMVGKSETLTLNSTCGSATLVNTTGTSSSVTLSRCF